MRWHCFSSRAEGQSNTRKQFTKPTGPFILSLSIEPGHCVLPGKKHVWGGVAAVAAAQPGVHLVPGVRQPRQERLAGRAVEAAVVERDRRGRGGGHVRVRETEKEKV